MSSPSSGCLDDETVVGFVDGTLAPDAVATVETHINGCADCRAVVAQAAQFVRPDEAATPASALAAGMTISRYVIRGPLGAGSAGVVYAAYDPKLRRPVAVKILVSGGERGSSGYAVRKDLLHEAQAMARLSHPNVVNVHDAGGLGDDLFLVMEYVEGQTLTRWLAERPRRWQDVLRAFLDAGRGLEAAHAAGLIHRDFKPDNVLVATDGRVRVTDFGLAKLARPSASTPAPVLIDGESTGTALAGTPAFMAPEQFNGAPADARSDQFSFCVSLFVALFGNHPFGTPRWMKENLPPQVPPPPARSPVPPRLFALLVRGLDPDRERRYPSMTELLAALEAVLRRRRVFVAWAVASTILAAAAGGMGWKLADAHRREARIAVPAVICGDGKVGGKELCDDGNLSDEDACLTTCVWAVCGDGTVRRGIEECDDGNWIEDDGCNSRCLTCRTGDASFSWRQNGHCYSRHDQPLGWQQAEAACEEVSGALLTYASDVEAMAVRDALGIAAPTWIGLSAGRPAGSFAWVTGEPIQTSMPWQEREPKLRCAFDSGSGWATADCNRPLPFVCEQRGWKFRYSDRHAYRLFFARSTWKEAAAACAASGAHLVTVGDPEEQPFIALTGTTVFWIGASNERVGQYEWVNAEAFPYRAFAPGEGVTHRTRQCVAMGNDDLWHERPCSDLLPYMCEVD